MDNKTTPHQVGGTITISGGEEIQIKPDSIQSNKSNKSSIDFVKDFRKAINEGLFKKEDGKESTARPTK
jgi:lactam utilization protein B